MKGTELFFLLSLNINVMAQNELRGVYQFNRQEMVAAFNFSTNNKFDFFYSYGAVDRTATGSFSIAGDTLKLKSDKEAGKDFTIKSESKAGTGYRLQFEDANKYLLSNIRCSFFTGEERRDEFTDNNGVINIDLALCDKIYVFHQLYPDMVTLVKDVGNDDNHFVLTLNPSLEQVSFKDFIFIIKGDKIFAPARNFLFPEDAAFTKQKKATD
ncbi:MAG: hypothetical protein ABJB11_12150 [Ferruginibacter sp.]